MQLIHDYASDVLIIQTAIQSSSTANTVVVGEDTDLLILLLHGQQRVVLQTRAEAKRKKKYDCGILKRQRKSWDPVFCSTLRFIHANTGCDTTSRLYGIGKTLSKVQCSDEFTKIGEVFMQIRMISSALEKKHLSFSTMVIQEMTWMLYATNDSQKRW